MTLAWKSEMPSGRKFVLVSLCDNANDQGECFPSISTIAERCSMGERTVQGHVHDLIKAGILLVQERAGRSNVYTIDPRRFRAPLAAAPPADPPPRHTRTPPIPHPAPAPLAPPPPQILHPTPADFAPITIKEPSIEPKGNQRKAQAPCVGKPDGVDPQVWADWLTLRKTKRAPVTLTVLDGAICESGKAGMTLNNFLKVWCERGSQGLMASWLKPTDRNQQNGLNPQEALEASNRAVAQRFLAKRRAIDASA